MCSHTGAAGDKQRWECDSTANDQLLREADRRVLAILRFSAPVQDTRVSLLLRHAGRTDVYSLGLGWRQLMRIWGSRKQEQKKHIGAFGLEIAAWSSTMFIFTHIFLSISSEFSIKRWAHSTKTLSASSYFTDFLYTSGVLRYGLDCSTLEGFPNKRKVCMKRPEYKMLIQGCLFSPFDVHSLFLVLCINSYF